jgi:hypothetical protein
MHLCLRSWGLNRGMPAALADVVPAGRPDAARKFLARHVFHPDLGQELCLPTPAGLSRSLRGLDSLPVLRLEGFQQCRSFCLAD